MRSRGKSARGVTRFLRETLAQLERIPLSFRGKGLGSVMDLRNSPRRISYFALGTATRIASIERNALLKYLSSYVPRRPIAV